MKPVVSPSILSADFSRLGEQLQMLHQAGMSWVHADVMDGHFVPNITIGPLIVKAVKRAVPQVTTDVHLMISDPARYVESFAAAGADVLYVHVEAERHLDRLVNRIRELGVRPGVSLNPSTPVDTLQHVLELVDAVLVMSVNPGFGGQKLIPYSLDKIKQLIKIRTDRKLDFFIAVDGGVHDRNIADVRRAGADLLVAGSAVFRDDPVQNFLHLKQILEDTR